LFRRKKCIQAISSMINKKKVPRILPSVGWWLFLLSGPASDYFKNSPARRVIIAVVGWVVFGLFIMALVIGYSEIRKPRAGVVMYVIGFALLMTSTLINSYRIVLRRTGLDAGFSDLDDGSTNSHCYQPTP